MASKKQHSTEHGNSGLLLNVIIGIATFGLFCLLFPNGAVSTLMHSVLHLPGPGTGIGMIYAQLLAAGLLASALFIPRHERRFPPVLFSALVVSASLIVFSSFGGSKVRNAEPLLGLPLLVAVAVLISALLVEVFSFAFIERACIESRPCFPGILATQFIGAFSCLLFYWFFILPEVTIRSMPRLNLVNALIITGLTLAASLIFSAIIHAGRRMFVD